MNTIDTSTLHWTFVDGATIPAVTLSIVDSLNRSDDRRGRVLHLTDGHNDYLLKLRVFHSLKDRLAATWGRSSLARESTMLTAARLADVPTTELIGLGTRRKRGLIHKQGLLTAWLTNHMSLRQRVLAATQAEDETAIEAARRVYIDLLARVRRAGLGDRDFGVGNVLVQQGSNAPYEPIWTDLEAAFYASPHDSTATGSTVAAALVSWWVATGEHTRWFQATFSSALDLLPEPQGGWAALLPSLNQTLDHRMSKQLRHGRINHVPGPLRLETAERR